LLDRRQLDLGTRKGDRAGNQSNARNWRINRQLLERDRVNDRFIDGAIQGVAIEAEAARGIALWIEVDDENPLSGECEIGREIDHRRGLTDAALLVGTGDRLAHSSSRPDLNHDA
jgi:hypothetical protein